MLTLALFFAFIAFSAGAPTISSLTKPRTPGSTITVTGSGFGNNPSSLSMTTTWSDGNRACTSFTIVSSDTSFTCVMPEGVGAGNAKVTVSGADSNTKPITYANPSITSVFPPSLPKSGGIVTVTGSNFGDKLNLISAFAVDDNNVDSVIRDCTIVQIITPHTKFTCQMDPGFSSSYTFYVYVASNIGSQFSAFSYYPIQVISVSPNYVSSQFGGQIVVSGADFWDTGMVVYVNGNIECTDVEITVPYTELTCNLPAGQSGSNRFLSASLTYGPPFDSCTIPSVVSFV